MTPARPDPTPCDYDDITWREALAGLGVLVALTAPGWLAGLAALAVLLWAPQP